MIFGVGTDIVDISRIEKLLLRFPDRFYRRILTTHEENIFLGKHNNTRPRFLAKRFAAKEAVAKALGTGFAQGITLRDIEIDNDQSGKPIVSLYNKAQQWAIKNNLRKIHVSLSDEHAVVVAFVVIEICNHSDPRPQI